MSVLQHSQRCLKTVRTTIKTSDILVQMISAMKLSKVRSHLKNRWRKEFVRRSCSIWKIHQLKWSRMQWNVSSAYPPKSARQIWRWSSRNLRMQSSQVMRRHSIYSPWLFVESLMRLRNNLQLALFRHFIQVFTAELNKELLQWRRNALTFALICSSNSVWLFSDSKASSIRTNLCVLSMLNWLQVQLQVWESVLLTRWEHLR